MQAKEKSYEWLLLYKNNVDGAASDLEDYVRRMEMEVEIPIYKDGMSKALNAQSRSLAMLPYFPGDHSSKLIASIESLSKMQMTMKSNRVANFNFRETIAKTPPVTTKLNQAKRNAVETLDKYLQELERSIILVNEVEKSLQDLLESISK